MTFDCGCGQKFDKLEDFYAHTREVVHEYTHTGECPACKKHFGPVKVKTLLSGRGLNPEVKCPDCQKKEDVAIIERLKAEGKI
jgi:hypothetical protein